MNIRIKVILMIPRREGRCCWETLNYYRSWAAASRSDRNSFLGLLKQCLDNCWGKLKIKKWFQWFIGVFLKFWNVLFLIIYTWFAHSFALREETIFSKITCLSKQALQIYEADFVGMCGSFGRTAFSQAQVK